MLEILRVASPKKKIKKYIFLARTSTTQPYLVIFMLQSKCKQIKSFLIRSEDNFQSRRSIENQSHVNLSKICNVPSLIALPNCLFAVSISKQAASICPKKKKVASNHYLYLDNTCQGHINHHTICFMDLLLLKTWLRPNRYTASPPSRSYLEKRSSNWEHLSFVYHFR